MSMRSPDPSSSTRSGIAPADAAYCAELLSAGSRSFDAAARLLPRDIRDDATALYAFCRVADDAVDNSTQPARALSVIRARLDAIYAGTPWDDAVDRAMACVVARHALPRLLPEALLDGLAWDAAGAHYDDLPQLRAYAVRVAGTVGLMMTLIMGRRDHDTLVRACELGVGMQLTNIARDVGGDARAGRCYLPGSWLREAGLSSEPARITKEGEARIGPIVARLLAEAECHYAYAEPGIAALPRRCRLAIHAAARIYAAIGDRIASSDHDVISQRAVVSFSAKLRAALTRRPKVCAPDHPPSANEMEEFIAAVGQPPCQRRDPNPQGAPLRWWQLRRQWIWVIELFAQLAERDALDKSKLPGFDVK